MRSRGLISVVFSLGCQPGGAADDRDDEIGESSGFEAITDLPSEADAESETDFETETGEPDCAEPQPCESCECVAATWQCECTPATPEAGFTTLEPHDYAIGLPGDPPTPLSASGHRQFWSYRPADTNAWSAPLFVFFNGGPAVSSAMLLGLNIGPKTFAPPATAGADLADNPHSWTRLGNLLWIDAHQVGFSYSVLDDPSDLLARQAALGFANFNSYLDAADFVRVLLRFLAEHPELRDNPVVIVAESYGGTRAQLMLDMLLHPQAYASGERRLIDPTLVGEIAAHHLARFGEVEPEPATIAEQFGHQVLIQPALTGLRQQTSAGALFELPDSPIEALASELGLDYLGCAEQQGPCSPYDNAQQFVASAGRSPYDTRAPSSWLNDLFTLTNARCNDAAALGELLGVALGDIEGLGPSSRAQAWRLTQLDAYPSDAEAGDLDDALGALAPWDRYFLVFEVGALNRFRGYDARVLEVDPADPHFGEHLLRNLLWVDTMITAASYDVVVYTPALPDALRQYDDLVAAIEVAPEQWTIDYRSDAFAQWPAPGSREVYVPSYAASHAVSLDAPEQLLADVEAWLGP